MLLYIITHPDVVIDPAVPVPRWPLSARGRERMARLLAQPWIAKVGAVYSSTEQKAIDGAEIIAAHLGLEVRQVEGLGEVDRSSTGYLPHGEHLAVADELFAHPEASIRGWETASHAQRRFADAIKMVVEREREAAHDIAVVAHGGVATFYLCYVKGVPISKAEAQPGANGGCYYCVDVATRTLIHGWKLIDE